MSTVEVRTPFDAYVDRYVEAGWPGVLPLPIAKKSTPPTGYTGANGAYANVTDIATWRRAPTVGNIGLRMTAEVIGIDVDNYDGKPGGATLAEYERRCGSLPATWVSTSRTDGVSGIRFYRLPHVAKLIGSLPGIEIVQRHHRYAVVAPSIHPEGREYRWIGPGGELGEIPVAAKLPVLPGAWFQELRADNKTTAHRTHMASGIEMAPAVERAYGSALIGMHEGTRHDTTLQGVTALTRLATQRFPGADTALNRLRDDFITAVTGDGSRNDREAAGEWQRMIDSAETEVARTPATIPEWEDRPPAMSLTQLAGGLGITRRVADPANMPQPDDPWPEPIPLGAVDTDLPPFPLHALPEWIAQRSRDVATDLGCYPSMPAMLAIGALATLCARKVTVRIDAEREEHTNLYLVVSAPPSAGKSPAYKKMCGPVLDIEDAHKRDMRAEIETNAIELKRAQDELDRVSKIGDADREEIINAQRAVYVAEDKPTTLPRLTVSDVTAEKLAKLVTQNGGRMAVHSTEGGVFKQMAGRYSERANLDPWLQGWSSDRIDSARIGRDDDLAPEGTITVVLTVQPHVIASLAEHDEFAGTGLTARFMYAVHPDDLRGHRHKHRRGERPLSDSSTAYRSNLDRIAAMSLRSVEPIRLWLSDEGHDAWTDFREALEYAQRPGGELRGMGEWVGKLEASVIRLAGLLHVAEDRPTTQDISAEAVGRAIEIGHYWLLHAMHVHDQWGTDNVLRAARKIVQWAQSEKRDTFTVRDIYAADRATFPRAEVTLEPLALLVERGWVRTTDGQPLATQRNKKSVEMTLNPSTSRHSARSARSVLRSEFETSSSSLERAGGEDATRRAERAERAEPIDASPVDNSTPAAPEWQPGVDDIFAPVLPGETIAAPHPTQEAHDG